MNAKAAEILTIFWALGDGRKQMLADEAQRLMDEQHAEDLGDGFTESYAAGVASVV